MSSYDRHGAGPAGPSGRGRACRVVIEICALSILVLSGISLDSLPTDALPVYVVYLAAVVWLAATKHLQSRAAVLGIPLVFMYAYARIDASRLSVDFSGDSPFILPVSVVVVAVMIYSFVIAVLMGGAAGLFRRDPVRALVAAVVFVSLLSGATRMMVGRAHQRDWLELQSIIGNAFIHGMLFVVLSYHLSYPRAIERFARYVMIFATAVVIAALVT